MITLIRALPAWLPIAMVAVAAFLLAWWLQGTRWEASKAKMARAHAEQVEQWAAAANEALQSARSEEQRRAAAVEDSRAKAISDLAASNADRDRYRSVAARLRRDIDSVYRDATSRDPSLAAGGPSGAATTGMLAYMLGRAIDRAEFLAGYADHARIAGLTCERAYGLLSGPAL